MFKSAEAAEQSRDGGRQREKGCPVRLSGGADAPQIQKGVGGRLPL